MMYRKKELDEWAHESIPILEQFGYLEKRLQQKTNWLLPLSLFLTGIFIGGIFIYGINNDAFKDRFYQTIEPNMTSNTYNDYQFETPIENTYTIDNNLTIINNVLVPDGICG